MCQRQSDDLPLLRIKKQLEELWQTTELLVSILSENCRSTKEALKPIVRVEKRSTTALLDPIVLSEQLEEKLFEKIDQVISYTHSAVEKSKGCLITVDSKLQKKTVVKAATGLSQKSDYRLEKEMDSKSTPKSKCSERTRKSSGQSRADFLKTTYGSAFGKPKTNATDKAAKFTRVCATNYHFKSVESNSLSSEKTMDNPFIFNDIDDLLRRAITCSKNGETPAGIDDIPQKSKVEFARTFTNLKEAIKTGLIEPHNELIQCISSYHRDLDRLTRPMNHSKIHHSRFILELEKRNQSCSASYEDSNVELQRCFSLIEKCPILAVGTATSKSSSTLSSYRIPVLPLKYNDYHKWLDLETKNLESFFWKQHLQILKNVESDINKLISIGNKDILVKTLSSLTSIVRCAT